MPCWIYMKGDPDPIMCNDAADEIMRRIEAAAELDEPPDWYGQTD